MKHYHMTVGKASTDLRVHLYNKASTNFEFIYEQGSKG